jgi:ectoine hydroxylase-related dioxygenase (phytanoyl-CoA dioxygenase family)
MNELQRYTFDTQGYLVLHDVLSAEQVRRLVAAVPRQNNGPLRAEKQPDVSNCFDGFLESPEPLFRELIDHPRVTPLLREIYCHLDDPREKQFFLEHEYGFVMQPGDRGGSLFHNGNTPYDPWLSYQIRDGKIFCGLTCVVWLLSDVNPDDGGFWCIPGSHKAAFPTPKAYGNGEVTPEFAVQPAAKAGSAILFTEALAHGTRPWRAQHERICLFYKYTPGYMGSVRLRSPNLLEQASPEQRRYLMSPDKLQAK